MGKVNQLVIVDSGNYFTVAPTVIVEFPYYDSANLYGFSDSAKFGCASLYHDSNTIMSLIDSDITSDRNGSLASSEISFWYYADSSRKCTLAWTPKVKLMSDGSGQFGVVYNVDSAYKTLGGIGNTLNHWNTDRAITPGQWNFLHVVVTDSNISVGVDSDASFFTFRGNDGTSASGGFLDSGTKFRLGNDADSVGPTGYTSDAVPTPVFNFGFPGKIDNFTFTTLDNGIFDSAQCTRVPDSVDDYYFNTTPMIHQRFDYRRAKGVAAIDSAALGGTGAITSIHVSDSGCGYTRIPRVAIIDNRVNDSDYQIGDSVGQTLSSGQLMTGEVARYKLDSAGDSDRYLYLAHVGSSDGVLRTFEENITVFNRTYRNGQRATTGLKAIGVGEDNKMSNTEQNNEFTKSYIDDFLDFTENNPFGDPEDQ